MDILWVFIFNELSRMIKNFSDSEFFVGGVFGDVFYGILLVFWGFLVVVKLVKVNNEDNRVD